MPPDFGSPVTYKINHIGNPIMQSTSPGQVIFAGENSPTDNMVEKAGETASSTAAGRPSRMLMPQLPTLPPWCSRPRWDVIQDTRQMMASLTDPHYEEGWPMGRATPGQQGQGDQCHCAAKKGRGGLSAENCQLQHPSDS